MGKIVIVPEEERVNKNRIFEILKAGLIPRSKDSKQLRSIFSDISDNERLSKKYKGKEFYARQITTGTEGRSYLSVYFYYDSASADGPFAWMNIFYCSKGIIEKLFGAQFSQKDNKKDNKKDNVTEMLIEKVVQVPLSMWIDDLKKLE